MKQVILYSRYERFWHWSQAALILVMLGTGADLHGLVDLLPFQRALGVHVLAAVSLVVLWIFTIFWDFTTGQWRQVLPTTDKLVATARYYAGGIFRGEEHPFHKTRRRKLNPLQAFTYLGLKVLVIPLTWVSGALLLFFNELGGGAVLDLGSVAFAHVLAAWLMLTFLVAHIYLATTGHSPLAHVRSMITGWDVIDERLEAQQAAAEGEGPA